jgi:hypothetical protein
MKPSKQAQRHSKNSGGQQKKSVATTEEKVVSSTQSAPANKPSAAPATSAAAPAADASGGKKMAEVNLTRSDKQRSTQMVVFTFADGRPGSVRISKTAFADKKAPETLQLLTDAYAGPRIERKSETKEERKARLAALPKPTPAEKLAKLQAKLAKLQAQVGASGGDQAAQASA